MKQARILHYEDVGTGPTVVLLHGYLASSQYWQRVITRLSKTNRVIAIDLLGFGKSPKPACSRYDYDAQLASINQTLDHAGVQNFTLVGHSMGSLLALRYAKQYESRITKLLLTNMPVLLDEREARAEILDSNLLYKYGLRPGMHSVMWPLFITFTYLRLIPRQVAEGAVDRRRYLFQNRSYSRLRSMRNVILASTIQADLARLDVATTLISGMQDRQKYLRNLPLLRQANHIVSKTIHGGHHLPITHPDIILQHI